MSVAGVAHPVERHLAKVEVASSSLVTRSKDRFRKEAVFFISVMFRRLEPSNASVRWTDARCGLDRIDTFIFSHREKM